MSLPPDPARPVDPYTCAEARARLAEAEAGSPLISAEEQAALVVRFRDLADALCDSCPPDDG